MWTVRTFWGVHADVYNVLHPSVMHLRDKQNCQNRVMKKSTLHSICMLV